MIAPRVGGALRAAVVVRERFEKRCVEGVFGGGLPRP